MPGLSKIDNRGFIRVFQQIDGVIQNNQPIFMLVWVGSTVAIVISAVVGFNQLVGIERLILITSTLVYILGVQWPTIAVNIPLNNKLQTLIIDDMTEAKQEAARNDFEPRWNRWNKVRTGFACTVSAALLSLLFTL
jgi:uncharacterized membrane protein